MVPSCLILLHTGHLIFLVIKCDLFIIMNQNAGTVFCTKWFSGEGGSEHARMQKKNIHLFFIIFWHLKYFLDNYLDLPRLMKCYYISYTMIAGKWSRADILSHTAVCRNAPSRPPNTWIYFNIVIMQ